MDKALYYILVDINLSKVAFLCFCAFQRESECKSTAFFWTGKIFAQKKTKNILHLIYIRVHVSMRVSVW